MRRAQLSWEANTEVIFHDELNIPISDRQEYSWEDLYTAVGSKTGNIWISIKSMRV